MPPPPCTHFDALLKLGVVVLATLYYGLQAYISRMKSKSIVVMVVVDARPTPQPLNSGLYRTWANTRVVAVKRKLREVHNPRGTQHHVLHVTDNPSENADILRCLGVLSPDPTAIAHAIAARTSPRTYESGQHDGAVEQTFAKGLRALSSPECMRGALATPAVVLKGNGKLWPWGEFERSDVRKHRV